MSLAALLQRRAVTPVTSSISTDVTAPGRVITEGYVGYVGYAENSKGETKTDDAPLKACAPSVMSRLSVDENRQRRTIEIEVSGVTGVTANDTHAEPESPAKIRPTANPAPSLSPDALEIAYAYLRAIGETDLAAGQAFIEAVARDPEQLRGLYEDMVKMGLADWPDDQATEPDSGIETTAKAVCARCAHWTPDRINPPGGLGHCTIAAPASKRPGSLWPWPDAEIHCTRFQEITPC